MTQQKDAIDLCIKDLTLPRNLEHFETIMKELELYGFWKAINTDAKYGVLQDVAMDRALNFYEGATMGGLTIHQVRIGLVTVIMSAVLELGNDISNTPYSRATYSIFCPVGGFKLLDLPLGCLAITQIEMAEKMIKILSRGVNSRTKANLNRVMDPVGNYILDALKFWVFSTNSNLLDILAFRGDRFDYLPNRARDSYNLQIQLGKGDITMYPSLNADYCLQNTPWGRMKWIKFNGPATINHLTKKGARPLVW